MFFNSLPNDLVSHTVGFTMVGPPDVVSRKSIIAKMIRHDFACLSMRVSTFVARTPSDIASFQLCKCSIQEILGLVNPLPGQLTVTPQVFSTIKQAINMQ